MRSGVLVVFSAALAVACGEIVAAKSDDTSATPPPAGSDGGGVGAEGGDDGGDAAVGLPPFSCMSQAADTFCDDFEDPAKTTSQWMTNNWDTGGKVDFVSDGSGQAIHFTAMGRSGVYMHHAIPIHSTSVLLDYDFRMPNAEINYTSIGYVHAVEAAEGLGAAMFGAGVFSSYSMVGSGSVPRDKAWHHVHVDIDAKDGAFTVKIDDTVVSQGTKSAIANAPTYTLLVGLVDLATDGTMGALDLLIDNVLLVTQ